jgi:thioredoxin-related protein
MAVVLGFAVPAFADGWTTNYAKALEDAKTQNKAVLLDFTGSDWCPWCIKMDKETLDKQAFKDYADKNLILVTLDFPQTKPQPEKVQERNAMLSKKYHADGFPTFVLLSPSGTELGRQVGYLEGGPEAFIAFLNKHYHPAPGAAGGGDDFDNAFKPVASPTP